MQSLLPHPLQIRLLLLSVQLEWLLELLTHGAGQIVDVPPASPGHHLHLGHHADAGGVINTWDADIGTGVDQLTWERQEDEWNCLQNVSSDERS